MKLIKSDGSYWFLMISDSVNGPKINPCHV